MAKRVLDEILTGIDAKKKKRAFDHHEEETSDDSESPSTPVKPKRRSQPKRRLKKGLQGKEQGDVG